MRARILGGLFIVTLAASSLSLGGCRAAQKAAQEDPMKCERDPKCQRKQNAIVDCSRQCNDDPACMDRCEQVQMPNKGLGH
ncbi:hypothetical protein [Labilithrix luteola]|uniref:hypothetical protein n=1 Tax=Labilithrix luteola TaxID=1391654 RepID=UPI0011BA89EE|nr:hypothetical protein [Labilithrix luteola]